MTHNRIFIRHVRTFAFLLFLAAPCFSDTTAVRYIPARDYFQTVSAEINSARHSIHAILYVFSLYPNSHASGVTRLADALVSAHNRGVDVRIVLDKGDFPAKQGDPAEPGDNRYAYEYLTARGVAIGFADVSAIVHGRDHDRRPSRPHALVRGNRHNRIEACESS